MSIKVMSMVSDTSLAPNHKLVLHAYADRADDNGESVYPGEVEVSWKTSYSLQTVRRITADLIEIGVLVRVKSGHRGQRAEYRISIPFLEASHNERLIKASHLTTESLSSERESLSSDDGKPLASEMPNVSDPSEPSVIHHLAARPRDDLWDTLIDLFGEPATKSERGKYNKIRAMLADADVTALELPNLTAAYMAKHSQRGSPAPQPTAMTIAQRVGELRHFITKGPIMSPNGGADRLAEAAEQARVFDELRQEFPEQALSGGES